MARAAAARPRRPDFETVAGDPRRGGERLDRRARRDADAVAHGDRARPGERLVGRAALEPPVGVAGVERLAQRRGDGIGRRRPLGEDVARPERVERLRRRPPVGGGDADPVRVLDDRDHAGHGVRGGAVEGDTAAAARRAAHRGMDHVAQPDVGGEARRAVDLGGDIEPGQRLTDQPVLEPAADREVVGQALHGGRLGQLGEGNPVVAAPDEAAVGVELLPVDVPAARGGPGEQGAGGGAGLAQPRLEAAHRGRSRGDHERVAGRIFARGPAVDAEDRGEGAVVGRLLGEQQVGVERADRRRLDRDGAPVGAELVGEDLGQAGIDALAELGLGDGDDDAAVAADLEEGVEQGLAVGGAQVGPVAAWPQAPGEGQADASAAADQQGPPADPLSLSVPRHVAPDREGPAGRQP